MASQGPKSAGTYDNWGVAPENSDTWAYPARATDDDSSYASITVSTFDTNDISYRLRASLFNFSFDIPVGSTIDGVEVSIERACTAGSARDYRVQLIDDTGTLVGDNKADTANNWPAVDTLKVYGGPADTWNSGIQVAWTEDTDFGFCISVKATAENTDIRIDYAWLTIYYTEPAAAGQPYMSRVQGVAGMKTWGRSLGV